MNDNKSATKIKKKVKPNYDWLWTIKLNSFFDIKRRKKKKEISLFITFWWVLLNETIRSFLLSLLLSVVSSPFRLCPFRFSSLLHSRFKFWYQFQSNIWYNWSFQFWIPTAQIYKHLIEQKKTSIRINWTDSELLWSEIIRIKSTGLKKW